MTSSARLDAADTEPALVGSTGTSEREPAPSPQSGAASKLRVGFAGSEPFVVKGERTPDGISIELWHLLAQKLSLKFELLPVATVGEGIERIEQGSLDVLVGPISITAERAKRVQFTYAYHQASLAIATRADGTTLWDRVGPFLSRAFFVGATSLLLVLFGVGALLWMLERKQNPEMFPRAAPRGIGNGVWMALVTMTTVGYGDRVPITTAGRIVTGVWMVVAMLSVSSLTAGIATTLTLAQLDRPKIEKMDQLAGLKVAVVTDTSGASFTKKHTSKVREVETIAAALELLAQSQVDAVVHDRPIISHQMAAIDTELHLSPGVGAAQGYGFALASDSKVGKPLSVAVLRARESGAIDELVAKWLGAGAQ